jgi:hypothetical protein
MSKQRLVTTLCAVFGLLLIASTLGPAKAQDEPKFTTTYRNWVRTSGGYISSNAPFTNAKANPAKIDFRGLHNVYANDKALGWLLEGKKGAAPDGSAFVIEIFTADPFVPGQVFLEDAKSTYKFTAWMFKDADEYKDTGGWRWEAWVLDKDGKDAFFGGAALDAKTQSAACVTCHTGFTKTDLVISDFSDKAHAGDFAKALGVTLATAEPTAVATKAPTRAPAATKAPPAATQAK